MNFQKKTDLTTRPLGPQKSWGIFFEKMDSMSRLDLVASVGLCNQKKIHPHGAGGHEEHEYKGSET